jgi:hypothetical protein
MGLCFAPYYDDDVDVLGLVVRRHQRVCGSGKAPVESHFTSRAAARASYGAFQEGNTSCSSRAGEKSARPTNFRNGVDYDRVQLV